MGEGKVVKRRVSLVSLGRKLSRVFSKSNPIPIPKATTRTEEEDEMKLKSKLKSNNYYYYNHHHHDLAGSSSAGSYSGPDFFSSSLLDNNDQSPKLKKKMMMIRSESECLPIKSKSSNTSKLLLSSSSSSGLFSNNHQQQQQQQNHLNSGLISNFGSTFHQSSSSGSSYLSPSSSSIKLGPLAPQTTTTRRHPSVNNSYHKPPLTTTTTTHHHHHPSYKSSPIIIPHHSSSMSLSPSPSPSPSVSPSPSPSPLLSPSPSPSPSSPSPSPLPLSSSSPLKLPSTLSVPLPIRAHHSCAPRLSTDPDPLPPAFTFAPPLSPQAPSSSPANNHLNITPSLLTPRQHSSRLRSPIIPSDSALIVSQPSLTPSDKTLKPSATQSSPASFLFPDSTSPLSSPLANLTSLQPAPPTSTNPPSTRSSTPSASTPPIMAAPHPTLALDTLSISGSSTRASPVRNVPNPSSLPLTSSLTTKLGPTTKLDVMPVKPSEPHMKSPVHPERKSMFGKLFEKRNGDATKDIKSSLPTGQLAASAPSTDAGSGNESETILANANKKSMMGRKPSHTNKKSSDAVVSTTTAMLHNPAESTPSAGNGVMGILSRQASTSNGPTNGGTAPATKILLSVNGHKATSDKSVVGADDAKVVSSSSKLRDMVGGKLGRKPSSSKPPRSEDGRLGEDIHINDSKSFKGSQATSTLLKKYGVCEKAAIGKGATAVVRLVHKWDRGTDKLYAVKEFRKRRKNESEKEYVKKLTSEFCISSTLHHENIVETVDLVQDENQHWCEVMEYCPGGDLYAAIKRGSMSQADIHSYFKQMILGVDYLHRMGVAHRDIKPENLLLDGKGQIKITDFGVSDVFRMCWEKTTHLSKGLCGSEPYLPKEMFERKEYDARLVDVWACAVVYYCCCMQELPWRVAKKNDPSFQTYLQAFDSGSNSPPPISNLQRESRLVIKKMWSPEPEHRIFIDQVLIDPWVASLVVLTADGLNGAPTASTTLSFNNNTTSTNNMPTGAALATTTVLS